MSPKSLWQAACYLGAVLALSGCVSLLPSPEVPTALYRLSAVEPVATPLGADLIVREPEAPRILAGQEIAAVGGDGALRLIDGVEWADAPTRLMQVYLIDTLNLKGDGFAVSPNAGGRAPYELDWRVSDLSIAGDVAICALEMVLLDGTNRAPLGRVSIRRSAATGSRQNSDRVSALVEATQTALQAAADQLATEVQQHSALKQSGGATAPQG